MCLNPSSFIAIHVKIATVASPDLLKAPIILNVSPYLESILFRPPTRTSKLKLVNSTQICQGKPRQGQCEILQMHFYKSTRYSHKAFYGLTKGNEQFSTAI